MLTLLSFIFETTCLDHLKEIDSIALTELFLIKLTMQCACSFLTTGGLFTVIKLTK